MSMSEVSFHFAVGVKAQIVEGDGYNVARFELLTAYGPSDKFSIFFERNSLGKFRLLAEAVEHIFGARTNPNAAASAQNKDSRND